MGHLQAGALGAFLAIACMAATIPTGPAVPFCPGHPSGPFEAGAVLLLGYDAQANAYCISEQDNELHYSVGFDVLTNRRGDLTSGWPMPFGSSEWRILADADGKFGLEIKRESDTGNRLGTSHLALSTERRDGTPFPDGAELHAIPLGTCVGGVCTYEGGIYTERMEGGGFRLVIDADEVVTGRR